MTYQVTKVISNTEIIIQPAYRGVSAADVICTKTIDTKVGQDDWNIDHADGDGPSGYILNLDKIQMCYMDYSWYGAGKIRFGFKDQNGHVKYVHEFKHNNRLTESYFRSGNLPARYEVINGDNPTYTGTLFHWGTSVIMDGTFQDDEAYMFTASGNVQKYTNAQAQQASTNNNSQIRNYYQGSWYNRTFFILMYFPTSDASKLQINTLIIIQPLLLLTSLRVAQLTPSLAQLVAIVKFMSNTLKVLKISSHIGTQAELTLHLETLRFLQARSSTSVLLAQVILT